MDSYSRKLVQINVKYLYRTPVTVVCVEPHDKMDVSISKDLGGVVNKSSSRFIPELSAAKARMELSMVLL